MNDTLSGSIEQRIDSCFDAAQRQEILSLCAYLDKVNAIPEGSLHERPLLYFLNGDAHLDQEAV